MCQSNYSLSQKDKSHKIVGTVIEIAKKLVFRASISFSPHQHMRGWNGQVSVLNIREDDLLEWTHPVIKVSFTRQTVQYTLIALQQSNFLFELKVKSNLPTV